MGVTNRISVGKEDKGVLGENQGGGGRRERSLHDSQRERVQATSMACFYRTKRGKKYKKLKGD